MSAGGERFNPFPGLRPFRMDERFLFFGREEQTAELVDELRSTRFLSVVGTSGSGKSSLVIAGLLPELHGGLAVDAGADWEVAVMRPGGSPLTNLAEALVAADLYDVDEPEVVMQVRATLSRSGLGLVEAARQSDLSEGSNLVVVVDQFEELFRFRRSGAEQGAEAGAFVRLLLEAVRQSAVPVYVVLTMRSDYLGDCAEFADLPEAVAAGVYLIPRLEREQVRRAITGPVKVGGGEIAPRLVQKLLNDTGDEVDYLPLLQHALMRTWQKWESGGGGGVGMDLAHYAAAGGMHGALSKHAEEVFGALDDEQRWVAARMFKALTEDTGDGRGVRHPLTVQRLRQTAGCEAGVLTGVVEAFRAAGRTFLVPAPGVPLRPMTVVDLTHESLMRVWGRLVGWLGEEAESAQVFQRLRDTAQLHARGDAGLFRDPDLQIALDWKRTQAPNEAWAGRYGGGLEEAVEFLEKSSVAAKAEAYEEKRRREQKLEQAKALAETQRRAARTFKRFAAALAGGLVVAVLVAVWAVGLKRQAVEAEGRANVARGELSQRLVTSDLAAAGEKLAAGDGNASLAHLARALWTDPGSEPAAARVMSMLASGRFPLRRPYRLGTEQPVWSADYHPRHDVVVTQSETQAVVWDVRTGERRFVPGDGVISGRTWWSADGERVIVMTAGAVQAWDLESGQSVGVGVTYDPAREEYKVSPLAEGGDRLGMRYEDGTLQVWNLRSGEPTTGRLGGGGGVVDWCFSVDGRQVCGLFEDGRTGVWDVSGGELVGWFDVGPAAGGRLFAGPGGVLVCLGGQGRDRRMVWFWPGEEPDRGVSVTGNAVGAGAFGFLESADGKPLAVIATLNGVPLLRGERRDGPIKGRGQYRVETIDLETGRRVRSVGGGEGTVLLPEIEAATGRFAQPIGVTVTGRDLDVWDLRDGSRVVRIGLPEHVDWGEISPDGQRAVLVKLPLLAGGSRSGSRAYVVDFREGRLAFPSPIEVDGTVTMSFGGDGSTLYGVVRETKQVRTWDAATGLPSREPIYTWVDAFFEGADRRRIGVMKFSTKLQGGREILTEGGVTVVETGSVPMLYERLSPRTGAPSLAGYAGGGNGEFTVRQGEFRSSGGDGGGEAWTKEVGGSPVCHDVGDDGRLVAVGFARGRLLVFDTVAREVVLKRDYGAAVRSCELSPDGSMVACTYQDRHAAVWSVADGAAVMAPRLFAESRLTGVRFSPDGERLAVFAHGGGLDLVDLKEGGLATTRVALKTDTWGGVFSGDGGHVVPWVWDFEIPVVDVSTGEVVRRLVHRDKVRRTAFSPDGELLACGGGGSVSYRRGFVEFWDWRTGKTARAGIDPGGSVERLVFSPDGKELATASQLGEGMFVQTWDVATGLALTEPVAAPAMVSSLAFRGDGRELLVGWEDGQVVRVPLPPRGEAIPSWVEPLAEAVGGKRLAARGGGMDAVGDGEIGRLRAALAGRAPNGAFERWAKWLLADPDERTIGPHSELTVKSYVDALRRSEDRADLAEALRLRPTDGVTYAVLSENELKHAEDADGAGEPGMAVLARLSARWYSDRSVAYAGNDEAVLATRARVMEALGDRREAARARERAGLVGKSWEAVEEGVPPLWREAIEAGSRGDWAAADAVVVRALEALQADERSQQGTAEAPVLPPVLEVLRSRWDRSAGGVGSAVLLAVVSERIGSRLLFPDPWGAIYNVPTDEAYQRLSPALADAAGVEARLLVERALADAGAGNVERAAAARFYALAGDRVRAVELLAEMLDGREGFESDDDVLVVDTISVLLWLRVGARGAGEMDEARMFEALATGTVGTLYGAEAVPEMVGVRSGTIPPASLVGVFDRQSVWRFFDARGGPGDGWWAVDFDDSGWKRGRARLGYGGDGETTVLSYGPDGDNKTVSSFFRAEVEIAEADLERFEALRFGVQRDDGVRVFLNGEEVIRDGLPDGEIGPGTLSERLASLEGETEFAEFIVPATALQAGRNVIAAAVHQATLDSSDAGFDLELAGVLEGGLEQGFAEPGDIPAQAEASGIPALLRGFLDVASPDGP